MIRYFLFAMVILTTGCAELPPSGPSGQETPRFLSLSPGSLGYNLSLSQIVTGHYDGQEYKMRHELDITPSRLAIVGLSPLGVTLFTIVEEGGKLSVETPTFGQKGFDPRYMLFDIYLTYWPSEILRPALSRIGMRLDDPGDGTADKKADGAVRRIQRLDGTMVAEIKYPPRHIETGKILIQHFDFPYRLMIETLEARRAP